MNDIVFICGARDFHAMDKYNITAKAVYPRKVHLLTDLIESEGQRKLITEQTSLFKLFIIDNLLFNTQSSLGHKWRNLVKTLFIPLQVLLLKRFHKKNPTYIYHAIPMYYMLLCYLAKIPFIGTPQGSEILVRPSRSKLYKRYTIKCLQAAQKVIVDSVNMQNAVFNLSGVSAQVFKNGFNTEIILKSSFVMDKNLVLSIRGMSSFYNIHKILEARISEGLRMPIHFVYPAAAEEYRSIIKNNFIDGDVDLGKLEKNDLYEIMRKTLLAISIPESDSSPRSVYECIFAGACVAATYSPYFDELPDCMKSRIYLVNLSNSNWLREAIDFAKKKLFIPYIPSEEALNMCDENRTIKRIVNALYS